MTTRQAPVAVTIFAYQVGFGDCFLLRFEYPGRKRHVLIDFGTTGLPKQAAASRLSAIASDIAEKCEGRLDAVVATHRHADHISGFATRSDGKGPGDLIRSLKPRVVIQPWTEQLDLDPDALGPKLGSRSALQARARSWRDMQEVARRAVELLDLRPGNFPKAVAAQLRFIGEDNLANASAVRNLATMAPKVVHTWHGGPSGLGSILPGVRTHVLGPPTLRQTEAIRRQRSRDPQEYWQLDSGPSAYWRLQLRRFADEALGPGEREPLFPGFVAHRAGKLPMSARWLAWRLKNAQAEQTLEIVRALDRQMNNTSLILLFDTPAGKLLFPGDAQIENWQYALSNPKYRALLEDVALYKVGHHGSLNATPRSLYAGFARKGKRRTPGRLKTLLSTLPGKHGSVGARTEVPRATLLSELSASSELHSTHTMPQDRLYEEIRLEA
jgi:hypothetical protein